MTLSTTQHSLIGCSDERTTQHSIKGYSDSKHNATQHRRYGDSMHRTIHHSMLVYSTSSFSCLSMSTMDSSTSNFTAACWLRTIRTMWRHISHTLSKDALINHEIRLETIQRE